MAVIKADSDALAATRQAEMPGLMGCTQSHVAPKLFNLHHAGGTQYQLEVVRWGHISQRARVDRPATPAVLPRAR